MASETLTQTRPIPPAENWPPDDTEESVLGIHLHQTTITNLRWGINEVAHVCTAPGRPAPWEATSQLVFLGCVRPNGTKFRTLPDVFVFPRPIDPKRGSFSLRVDGPPLLIIEVLSDSTYKVDLDLERGKGYSYARVGTPEYIALDPTGEYISEGIRAWRLDADVYYPWKPEADGLWHSASIGIAIGLEGMLASVYTRDGLRMQHEGEVQAEWARLRAEHHEALAKRDAELARRDAELARRDAELAQRDEELERLRRLLDERSKD